ncbi:MAG TPA: protease inhibitor I42 family protein [Candidatus Eremiobacteraeota bacterium]|nr:MAG: hypothetical protein BWY64_00366 [bacterium ADurb.Bin363]HPZ08934.1 protease inhibitor I42 family protein [Candidatus Eremiobacteraeota bacterium]
MKLKSYFLILCIFIISFEIVWPQSQSFIIHIAKETMALGNRKRLEEPNRPSWWPDPQDTEFETTFNVPFSPVSAELCLEVLGVNSAKNYVEINGKKVGALYPDGGMTFVPSVVKIPVSMLQIGENTLVIEADKGLTDEGCDNFLIKNVRIVLYSNAVQPFNSNTSVTNNADYIPEQRISLPSFIDVVEGESFSLKLIASSIEGYRWQLHNYDSKLLRLVSEQPPRVYDKEGRIEQQFDFIALIAGNTDLEFRKFYTDRGELTTLGSQKSQIRIAREITLTGTIQECSVPEFGTHQLVDSMENILCVLRSPNAEIDFDKYTGVKVKVVGKSEYYEDISNSVILILTVRNITKL